MPPCHLFQNQVYLLIFQEYHQRLRVSNSLDPDPARHFVNPDSGLNCLHLVGKKLTSFMPVSKDSHRFR